MYQRKQPTVCVIVSEGDLPERGRGLAPVGCGAGVGVDSVWEYKKLEAKEMLVNRTESPVACPELVEGSSAALLGVFVLCKTRCPKKDINANLLNFLYRIQSLTIAKKDGNFINYPSCEIASRITLLEMKLPKGAVENKAKM